MKFARYLEETQTPEWKKAYIDYRGLKKRITAIRRIQEQDNIEPGTTSALALSPYPSAGAPADTGPTTLLEDAETSAPAPVHVAGHGSAVDNAHNNGCASSPVLAHSDTATSSGVLPRLRRRSTVVSRAQSQPQAAVSPSSAHGFQRLPRSPWPPGSNPPLREILPLLAPVERAFFDKLDSELDKVESFFCARERELKARYEVLKTQLQTLKNHRRAFHEAHPHAATRRAWLRPPPVPSFLHRIYHAPSAVRMTPLPSIRLGKQRTGSDHDHDHDGKDAEEEERTIGDTDHIISKDVEMHTFKVKNAALDADSIATVERVRSIQSSEGNSSANRSHIGDDARPLIQAWESGQGSEDKKQNGFTHSATNEGLNGKAKGITTATIRDPDEYREAKKTLKKAVQECYRGLEVLNNYRTLNLIGFRKALKKFEKVTLIPAQQAYTVEKIEPSAFASGASLDRILRELEDMFAARFARGDKKKAQARLRSDSQHKSHHFSTFRSGMLLGLAVPALADGIVKSFQPETRAAIPSWDGLLFVYGIFLVPVLFSLLIGLNLLVWHKARINYTFIFELDLRTRLDYREYFEVPTLLLSTLCYALWLSFARVGASTITPSTWPLLWLVWALAVWLNPLPILYRPSRYWFVRNLGRQLSPGVRRVEFQDFWMGDQFCSLAFTLGNLYFVGCAYSHDVVNWRRCTTGKYWAPAFALAALPFFVRFVQSIKRWVDSRLVTHLINAGKYGTGIIYYFTYYLWRAQGGGYGSRFVAWVILGICYATYAAAWDILMDWSLMRRHAKYPLLRSDLIYTSYVPLYYFAIISNIVIRFEFLMYIPEHGINYVIRTFIAAMLEMLRRWQWNFYRLENEHVGNMDQYRVTREVPLPYSFDASHDSDGGDEDDDLDARLSISSRSWRRRNPRTPLVEPVEDSH